MLKLIFFVHYEDHRKPCVLSEFLLIVTSGCFKLRSSSFHLQQTRIKLLPKSFLKSLTKFIPPYLDAYRTHQSPMLPCNKNVVNLTFLSSGQSVTLKHFLTKLRHFSKLARFAIPSRVVALMPSLSQYQIASAISLMFV